MHGRVCVMAATTFVGKRKMDIVFDLVHQFWLNFQHGQLPDVGGWNYMLMAFLMMVQGRASALVGGIAAAAGYLNLGLIILVALTARLFLDLFWYKLGSTGHLDRVGRRIGFYNRAIGAVKDSLEQKPRQVILLAKLSNGLAVPAVIAAGNARIPFRRWLPASFVGEIIWTMPLLMLGYFATDSLSHIEGGVSYLTMGFTVVFFLLMVVRFTRSRLARARHSTN